VRAPLPRLKAGGLCVVRVSCVSRVCLCRACVCVCGVLISGGTSVLIQHYLLELGRLEAQCDPASTTAHWVPDDTVDSCRHCSSAFSKLTRRVLHYYYLHSSHSIPFRL
jgi:hypothetical protein